MIRERCSDYLISKLKLEIVLDYRLIEMDKCMVQKAAVNSDYVLKLKTVLWYLLAKHFGNEAEEALG